MPCHDNVSIHTVTEPDPKTEQALCEARWLILQMAARFGTGSLPRNWQRLVAQHRQGQIEHRRRDRRYVLQELDQQLAELRRDLSEIRKMGGKPGVKLGERLRKLVALRESVKGLGDEDLLEGYWRTETCVARLLKERGR